MFLKVLPTVCAQGIHRGCWVFRRGPRWGIPAAFRWAAVPAVPPAGFPRAAVRAAVVPAAVAGGARAFWAASLAHRWRWARARTTGRGAE